MIGITSFGGYIPRLRIERMTIYGQMGWYAPATITVAQGERSFGNWDEDSLTMAVEAARDCLVGIGRQSLQAVHLATTTSPFADRSGAVLVKEALALDDAVACFDLGNSQRAGTQAVLAALGQVAGGMAGQALVVAADQRQARPGSLYEMWFGDGAAALCLGREGVIAEFLASHSLSADFVDHYRGADKRFDYTWEERWVRDAGYARLIPQAAAALLEKAGLQPERIDHWVYPCFFSAEHRRLGKRLGARPEGVAGNLHEVCGECGTAHPLVMLAQVLERARPGEYVAVVGFGSGCDALLFRVTEAIAELPARRGISGCLEDKQVVDNYSKFLLFRQLIEPERGIRAEAPTQTALSVLWRERRMLHGLVGGRCRECGTVQFPRMEVCVNPECRAHHSQDPEPFADKQAQVKTFTGDYLSYTVDPPAIYGMIQFAGGGRFMADFTDCQLEQVRVGMPVRMVFRRRYQDRERGFSGYFWKARPLGTGAAAAQTIRFDEQVAVITGAGGGLGRDYALELARRGARVVVADFGGARDGSGGSRGPADEVVAEIAAAGGEAVACYADVSRVEGAREVIAAAREQWGRVDVVIHNAGILRDRTLLKMSDEEWEGVQRVHLWGGYWVIREALPLMKEQGYGRVVVATSAAGLFGNYGQGNYAAAKLGLVGLMNVLKLEGERYGVKVNAVAPLARTRLTEDILPGELAERLRPEFVTPLVVYLCSEQCPASGGIYNVGGGYFGRAALVSAAGVNCGSEPSSAEQLLERFAELDSLEGASEYHDAMAALTPMLSSSGK